MYVYTYICIYADRQMFMRREMVRVINRCLRQHASNDR